MRQHRRLTLMLNTVLVGRIGVQDRRAGHSWGCFHRDGGELEVRWVQNEYFGRLGRCVLDAPRPLPDERLEVIPGDRYLDEVRGIDVRGLRVPSDLDESIHRYQLLPTLNKTRWRTIRSDGSTGG